MVGISRTVRRTQSFERNILECDGPMLCCVQADLTTAFEGDGENCLCVSLHPSNNHTVSLLVSSMMPGLCSVEFSAPLKTLFSTVVHWEAPELFPASSSFMFMSLESRWLPRSSRQPAGL